MTSRIALTLKATRRNNDVSSSEDICDFADTISAPLAAKILRALADEIDERPNPTQGEPEPARDEPEHLAAVGTHRTPGYTDRFMGFRAGR